MEQCIRLSKYKPVEYYSNQFFSIVRSPKYLMTSFETVLLAFDVISSLGMQLQHSKDWESRSLAVRQFRTCYFVYVCFFQRTAKN